MLSRSARAVLDTALQKYRPGRTDLIPVGGIAQLKPALRLMMSYRLVVREVVGAEVFTSYTRWLECVQVKEGGAGSLRSIQSAIRADLAGIKETPAGVHGAEAGQHRAAEPVRSPPLQLGEEIRRGRNQKHFAGRPSKGVRPGVDQGCGRKCH